MTQEEVALQKENREELLEQQVLVEERKHDMADLVLGVSQDVNNALGAVLPLVHQLARRSRDIYSIPRSPRTTLRQIEHSIQL